MSRISSLPSTSAAAPEFLLFLRRTLLLTPNESSCLFLSSSRPFSTVPWRKLAALLCKLFLGWSPSLLSGLQSPLATALAPSLAASPSCLPSCCYWGRCLQFRGLTLCCASVPLCWLLADFSVWCALPPPLCLGDTYMPRETQSAVPPHPSSFLQCPHPFLHYPLWRHSPISHLCLPESQCHLLCYLLSQIDSRLQTFTFLLFFYLPQT